MRILALETSLQSGSIALLDADQLVWQSDLPTGKRTAQTLVPAIREALESLGWSSRDVGLVAVASGPGSFTGLRIGVTTAKVFAYATGSHIIDLNTLDVIAAQCPSHLPPFAAATELWAVMDAQRGELFAARFTADGRGVVEDGHSHLCRVPRTWCAQLHPQAAVTGPGLARPGGPPGGTCGLGRLGYPSTGNPVRRSRLSPGRPAPKPSDVWPCAVTKRDSGTMSGSVLPQYFRPAPPRRRRGKSGVSRVHARPCRESVWNGTGSANRHAPDHRCGHSRRRAAACRSPTEFADGL